MTLRAVHFPVVHFVNTNLPEERTQVLLSKKELNELPDDNTDTFINIQILTGTLIDQMHYLVVENIVL